MSYITKEDLFDCIGECNAMKWADIDNDCDEVKACEVIERFLEKACCYIEECLAKSIVKTYDPVPETIKKLTAMYAAVCLHQRRGVSEQGDRMKVMREEIRRMLKDIKSGRQRLKGSTTWSQGVGGETTDTKCATCKLYYGSCSCGKGTTKGYSKYRR